MAAGGAGAAAAAAAIAQAIKASGVLVRLDPVEFMKIVGRLQDPLVVVATGGLFTKNYQYLMGYKGLAFYTKSAEPLQLPATAEVIAAKSIWTPN
jgi:hypothetical protein